MTFPAEQTMIQNDFLRHEAPIHPDTQIDMGDMVFADVNGLTLPMSAGSGLQFLGVAEDSNPITSLGEKKSQITVRRRGVARLNTTVGDVYNAYAPVFGGANAKTVTVVSTGRTLVGYVCPEQRGLTGTEAGFPITGAAGVRIDIVIAPQFPVASV